MTYATFTRDSQCLLLSSENVLRLFDKENGEILSEYSGHNSKEYLIECCVSLKDNYVLSGSANKNLWCWELLSSKCFKLFPHENENIVHSISPHPTKELYATAAGSNIYLWGENNEQ